MRWSLVYTLCKKVERKLVTKNQTNNQTSPSCFWIVDRIESNLRMYELDGDVWWVMSKDFYVDMFWVLQREKKEIISCQTESFFFMIVKWVNRQSSPLTTFTTQSTMFLLDWLLNFKVTVCTVLHCSIYILYIKSYLLQIQALFTTCFFNVSKENESLLMYAVMYLYTASHAWIPRSFTQLICLKARLFPCPCRPSRFSDAKVLNHFDV
jgi:hypothetical protein